MKHIVCVLKTNEGGLWAVPQLEELRNRGHRVTMVIPPGDGRLRRLLDEREIEVVESAFDFSFRPGVALAKGLWSLRRQLRALAPDVVFFHLYASALAVRLSMLFTGVKTVHMVAGPLYLDSTVIRNVEKVLCRLDDVVIGGSEHTADRYRALGMPASRVRAIPYGVDLTRFEIGEVVPSDPAPETFTVIMVAYVYAPKSAVYPGVGIKGHEVLLQAWAEFVAQHPQSRLVLVGAGFDTAGETHRAALKEQWAEKLGSTVLWIDTVPDVRGWYASSAVSISPSLSENHGAALEASAMARPSIVSTAGALPETVLPGRSGWIVSAGDVPATLQALTEAHEAWSRGELDEMGREARALVEREFAQADCSRRVADVVESV